MKRLQTGFSLIELMIVIAIIGILAAIAVPSYQTYVLKSKLSKMTTALEAGELAVSEYLATSGASDCSEMPMVAAHGPGYVDFSIPPSDVVSRVVTQQSCLVNVMSQPGIWGSGQAIFGTVGLQGTPSIDGDGNISWSCFTYAAGSFNIPFAPSTCPSLY